MKPPDITDTVVKVTAYMTDESFGYDHWRAAQFSSPQVPSRRPAVLVICDNEAHREILFAALKVSRP